MRAVAFNIHSLVQFVLVNTGAGFREHTEVPLANQAVFAWDIHVGINIQP